MGALEFAFSSPFVVSTVMAADLPLVSNIAAFRFVLELRNCFAWVFEEPVATGAEVEA